jgi:hypothetical protein
MSRYFPPHLERRVKATRLLAWVMVITFPFSSYAVYWLLQNGPRTPEFVMALYGMIAVFLLEAVVYIHLVVRMGEYAKQAEEEGESTTQ